MAHTLPTISEIKNDWKWAWISLNCGCGLKFFVHRIVIESPFMKSWICHFNLPVAKVDYQTTNLNFHQNFWLCSIIYIFIKCIARFHNQGFVCMPDEVVCMKEVQNLYTWTSLVNRLYIVNMEVYNIRLRLIIAMMKFKGKTASTSPCTLQVLYTLGFMKIHPSCIVKHSAP